MLGAAVAWPEGATNALGQGPDGSLLLTFGQRPASDDWDAPWGTDTLALWKPGVDVEWLTERPKKFTPGPAIIGGAASEDWVTWMESDGENSLDSMPYVIKSRARSGGNVHVIGRSTEAWHGNNVPPPGLDHHLVVVGDSVYWVDTVPSGEEDGDEELLTTGIFSARMDGSGEPSLGVFAGWLPARDECLGDDVLALNYQFMDPDVNNPLQVRRRTFDVEGAQISDDAVWSQDLADRQPESTAACGSTVALGYGEHLAEGASGSPQAEVVILHAGVSYSFVWEPGTGSSPVNLAVGPDLVTFSASGGDDDGARYVFDLATATLHEIDANDPNLAFMEASPHYVLWAKSIEGGDPAKGTADVSYYSSVIPAARR